jgi:hypothetical protein
MNLYVMNTTYVKGAMMALLVLTNSCAEPDYIDPVPNTSPSVYSASFIFANATADAASLDFYVNNLKLGSSVAPGQGQGAYTVAPLTSSGATGSLGTNTNIRAKATTGSIGGTLNSSDAIYRAANNNSNNFTALDQARYSIFALDSVTRPKPVRLLNASNFADTTYFNRLTGTYISVVERAALASYEKSMTVPIGTVPLGSSDPGGIRFYLVRDIFPTFSGGNVTQSAIRVVNGIPNTPVWVRLVPVNPGSNVTLGSNVAHITSFPGFNPSVGSRTVVTTTANFTLTTTAAAGVPIDYNIEVSTNSGFTNIVYTSPAPVQFDDGKIYTVFTRGIFGNTGALAPSAGILIHN